MSDLGQFQLSGKAAENYEKIPARYILGPWATGLVEAADIQPDENVLDVACGTGLVTRTAAAKLGPQGRITGLDLNEGMLEVARNLATTGAAQPTWIRNRHWIWNFRTAVSMLCYANKGCSFFRTSNRRF
jgi:2-polyprenyl-3-methyl-5-hydroxy-6-metoxy-1,4-benzoquinol methylase